MSTTAHTSQFQWRSYETAPMTEVAPWIETMGRVGYFAKGLVYLIVGTSAIGFIFGVAGKPGGSTNAIREIGRQPFGKVLLALMAVALLGYFLWRMVQTIKDTEAAGHDAKGVVKRSGYFISGLAYATLAATAASIALGMGGGNSGGGSTEAQAKSTLLQSTWGQVLIAGVGVIVIAVALHFVHKGWKAKFMSKYNLSQMSESVRKIALHVGRTGLIMRGVAFSIIGWFLVQTGMNGGSGEGKFRGMSDAIEWLAAQPFGLFLVGTVGFGLACFGVHTMLLGYYRRFNVS